MFVSTESHTRLYTPVGALFTSTWYTAVVPTNVGATAVYVARCESENSATAGGMVDLHNNVLAIPPVHAQYILRLVVGLRMILCHNVKGPLNVHDLESTDRPIGGWLKSRPQQFFC